MTLSNEKLNAKVIYLRYFMFMYESEFLDEEALHIIRAKELLEKEFELFSRVALELIESGSSQFEYGESRYLLGKSGLSFNPGFHIDSENLDGSNRFRHSWSAFSGDTEWQIRVISNKLARLLS